MTTYLNIYIFSNKHSRSEPRPNTKDISYFDRDSCMVKKTTPPPGETASKSRGYTIRKSSSLLLSLWYYYFLKWVFCFFYYFYLNLLNRTLVLKKRHKITSNNMAQYTVPKLIHYFLVYVLVQCIATERKHLFQHRVTQYNIWTYNWSKFAF